MLCINSSHIRPIYTWMQAMAIYPTTPASPVMASFNSKSAKASKTSNSSSKTHVTTKWISRKSSKSCKCGLGTHKQIKSSNRFNRCTDSSRCPRPSSFNRGIAAGLTALMSTLVSGCRPTSRGLTLISVSWLALTIFRQNFGTYSGLVYLVGQQRWLK